MKIDYHPTTKILNLEPETESELCQLEFVAGQLKEGNISFGVNRQWVIESLYINVIENKGDNDAS
jgi:hypothetical protein